MQYQRGEDPYGWGSMPLRSHQEAGDQNLDESSADRYPEDQHTAFANVAHSSQHRCNRRSMAPGTSFLGDTTGLQSQFSPCVSQPPQSSLSGNGGYDYRASPYSYTQGELVEPQSTIPSSNVGNVVPQSAQSSAGIGHMPEFQRRRPHVRSPSYDSTNSELLFPDGAWTHVPNDQQQCGQPSAHSIEVEEDTINLDETAGSFQEVHLDVDTASGSSEPWSHYSVVDQQHPSDMAHDVWQIAPHSTFSTYDASPDISSLSVSFELNTGTSDTSYPMLGPLADSQLTTLAANDTVGPMLASSQHSSMTSSNSAWDYVDMDYTDDNGDMSFKGITGPARQYLNVPDDQQSVPRPISPALSVTPPDVPVELSCVVAGCPLTFKGEYRLGTRQRHMRHKHGAQERMYNCEDPDCNKSFKRTDSRLKHYRTHHPYLAPKKKQPRPKQSRQHYG